MHTMNEGIGAHARLRDSEYSNGEISRSENGKSKIKKTVLRKGNTVSVRLSETRHLTTREKYCVYEYCGWEKRLSFVYSYESH